MSSLRDLGERGGMIVSTIMPFLRDLVLMSTNMYGVIRTTCYDNVGVTYLFGKIRRIGIMVETMEHGRYLSSMGTAPLIFHIGHKP
jgi:hypothetical protein